jgi:ZIP family zinc transporter
MGLGGGVNVAFLASVFVSNLPEGVAGTLNLKQAGYSYRIIFRMWLILVILSAMCAGLGYLSMQWLPVDEGVLVQAFAAGAMLTMLADAMIPEAYEHGGKMVGLFTVFGFLAAALLSVLQ